MRTVTRLLMLFSTMETISTLVYTVDNSGQVFMNSAVREISLHTNANDEPIGHETDNRLIRSLDALGIFASSLCLVHCLAMPLIIGFLPILGWGFLEGHRAHVILAFFVLTFALTALVPGYLRHRRRDILLMMLVGLSLVLSATFALPES